jgi:hypothetical protein
MGWNALNFGEWKLLEGAVKVLNLKPFKIATKVLEDEFTPTINLVIEQFFKLKTGLELFINKLPNCQYGITFARSLLSNVKGVEHRFLKEKWPTLLITVINDMYGASEDEDLEDDIMIMWQKFQMWKFRQLLNCWGNLVWRIGTAERKHFKVEVWDGRILPTPGEAKAKAMPGRLYIHTK